jgi:TldD protein
VTYDAGFSRREFVAAGAAALWTAVPWRGRALAFGFSAPPQEPDVGQLCMLALDAARSAGAEYADARVIDRAGRVYGADGAIALPRHEVSSMGFGVRALVNGQWGFGATQDLRRDKTVAAAQSAVAAARTVTGPGGITMAPARAAPDAEWHTPIISDPFDGDHPEIGERLLAANVQALAVEGVAGAHGRVECLRVRSTFASTDGSLIRQTLYRTWPSLWVSASAPDGTTRTRRAVELTARAAGLEVVDSVDLSELGRRCAKEAVALAVAPVISAGTWDLVLEPAAVAGVVRTLIGGATRAGSTVLGEPTDVLRRFRVGPAQLQIQCDRTELGALATVGWDDEGVAGDSWPVVRDGVLVDYQTTRADAERIAALTGRHRSHGCAVAPEWNRPPRPTMANLALVPGADDVGLDALIAATDRGVLVSDAVVRAVRDGGRACLVEGLACSEIGGGKRAGFVAGVTFEAGIPDFWNAVDLIGGPTAYRLTGTRDDTPEAEDALIDASSVGAPPVRVRAVELGGPTSR